MIKYFKNLGKTAIAAATALSLYPTNANAEDNPEERREFNQDITPLDVATEFALAAGLQVAWHELGHYSTIKLFGYDAVIQGPGIYDDHFFVARTKVPEKDLDDITNEEWAFFASAGLGFTSLGNVTLTNYLINTNNENSLRPFLGALSLTMMFDRYWYGATSIFWHYLPGYDNVEGDDVNQFINSIGINEELCYALLALETSTEIFLRWGEIRYLWQTAIGNNPDYEPTGIIISLIPGKDFVRVQLATEF